jgi:uncharacterized OB-fold protein
MPGGFDMTTHGTLVDGARCSVVANRRGDPLPPLPYSKPLPEPDELSEAYWSAAARHALAIQSCVYCEHLQHPPAGVCRRCRNALPRFAFRPVSGKGRLKSWTVMRDSFIPAFRDDVPFVIGLVELVEQADVRLIAKIMDGPLVAYRIGMPVEVVFQDVAEGISIPNFRLSAAATSA